MRDRKVHQLMLDGVTIERPETVTVDTQVRIGMDTVIGPFAQITGDTVIGENCRIGASAILDSAVLEDDVDVFPFTIVTASRLDTKSQVGPFARIRMGAHLGASAHVGNFVELKKTAMGAGSKSMHLAYLGDSVIGSKVNIGAGTITCNYDGQKKHADPSSAMVRFCRQQFNAGSAARNRATESYIAAGSVINMKVPPDTLAVGRSRQVNKEGWKKRHPNL